MTFVPPAGATDAFPGQVIASATWNAIFTDIYAILNTVLGGNVAGPASAVDGNVATYNGTSGKIIKDALVSITNVPVVSPIGPSQTGNTLARLNNNWVQAADTYSIASADTHVLPITALLSGSPAATFTIRLQWGVNDISKTSTIGGTLAAVTADLLAKLQADATIAAAGIDIQYNAPVNSALLLIAPPYSITLTVSSTGGGTITVGGSPSSNVFDVNPIIAMGRSVAGRAAQTGDNIGSLFWYGQDSTGSLGTNGLGTVPYGCIIGSILTATAGSVAGQLYFGTALANTVNVRFAIASGLYMFSNNIATIGGDPGAGGIGADLIRVRNNDTAIPAILSRNSATSPTAVSGTILQLVSAAGSGAAFELDGVGGSAQILMRRNNGTTAVPTKVTSGNNLGSIVSGGYGGTFGVDGQYFNSQGGLYVTTPADWSATSTPTQWYFTTTPVGSTIELTRLYLKSDGFVGIGTTNPQAYIHINKNTVQNTTPYAGTMLYLSGQDGGTGGLTPFIADAFAAVPFWFGRRANTTAAAPSAVVSGNLLFIMGGGGYYTSGGTAYSDMMGSFRVAAAQNYTSSAQGTDSYIESTAVGSTTAVKNFQVTANANIVIGSAALLTTATDGFLYLTTCPGAPTGNSTDYTGRLPMVYDTTNDKLWINTSGTTWKGVVLS